MEWCGLEPHLDITIRYMRRCKRRRVNHETCGTDVAQCGDGFVYLRVYAYECNVMLTSHSRPCHPDSCLAYWPRCRCQYFFIWFDSWAYIIGVVKWNEGKAVVKCVCNSSWQYIFQYCYLLLCSRFNFLLMKVTKWSCPRNRPWRSIGLWDVKDPTLSRQWAHRWR
jgi:hypothetical protein